MRVVGWVLGIWCLLSVVVAFAWAKGWIRVVEKRDD